MNEMMELSQTPEEIVIQEKHEDLMQFEASKTVPFVTAAWASIGVSILASSMGSQTSIINYLSDNLAIAVPFVAGVYISSYLGGRWLTRKKIRENVFLSIGASFLVAEGVLFLGSAMGSMGGLLKELITGASYIDYGEFFLIPLAMVIFGAMFCLPLAVGLGAHVRLWSLWKGQKLQREAIEHELHLPEPPVVPQA